MNLTYLNMDYKQLSNDIDNVRRKNRVETLLIYNLHKTKQRVRYITQYRKSVVVYEDKTARLSMTTALVCKMNRLAIRQLIKDITWAILSSTADAVLYICKFTSHFKPC